MKKVLVFIFLGILSLNLNVHAMQSEQNSEIAKPKTKFTKLDWAKLVAAGSGCGLSTFAALMVYPTMKINDYTKEVRWFHIPTIAVCAPFALPINLTFNSSNEVKRSVFKKSLWAGGIVSGLISLSLGNYVHKKLSSLKKQKEIMRIEK